MANARPVRWLHLSDLHLGCRGQELWWQVETELARDVRAMVEKRGAGPDLLLFSGDLTFRGDKKEFELVERFLDALRGWLREAGSPTEPILLAVPGNHDVVRPAGADITSFRAFDRWATQGMDDEDVRLLHDEFWTKGKPKRVAPLFAPYQSWFAKKVWPEIERRAGRKHRSRFPGDFSAEIDVQGAFPLLIVGLNSAWLQYSGADFERKLALPLAQFQTALPRDAKRGESPLAVFESKTRAFLMMHHPPSWLSKKARDAFNEGIYPPDRFDLCLHGHLHESRTETVLFAGGKPRSFFQAPSLFGMEHWGTSREERLVGWTWGELSAGGEVRLWPRIRTRHGAGNGIFVHDPAYGEEAPHGIRIGWQPAHPTPPPPARADFEPYLRGLVADHGHIAIVGVSRAGENQQALRPRIERLYTPLRCRGGLDLERAGGDGVVGLASLLPRHSRLLLEGQPGAGKTTFLRFVACLLARDLLGEPCPDGPSWREWYLGLSGAKPALPVFVRLAALVPLLEKAPLTRRDNRGHLLDLLAEMSRENHLELEREAWERLLEGRLAGQEAILLLDGLDEVADEALRRRVFEIFRDAEKHWPGRLVVTSRPLETATLREMGFACVTVEPFEQREIQIFLEHWVDALYRMEGDDDLSLSGERYREDLTAAICKRPNIRRLATNPVMLTCLCVIHWNEQRLPEGRTRVYRAVLRWLLSARSGLRQKREILDYFAERAFAALALAMMRTKRGKQAIFDLEAAAAAVDPIATRDWPHLAEEDRRRKVRDWLRFECLGSGIVEELPRGRLRFWHLTFQEFLASLQLTWRGDGDSEVKDWWPLVQMHLDDAQWRETIEFLPGCLLDEGGQERVDLLLERVLGLQAGDADLATVARVAGIVGRLLPLLTAYGYQPKPEIAASHREALDRSLAIFTPEGAARVPVTVRIAAAEALGRGGDPRLAPEVDNFLNVPGLDGVWLGKYPVTVEEYQRFVEGRGYEEERFWGPEGWKEQIRQEWTGPGSWDEQLTHPNRPVTEVSWWEAVAYCKWSSEQQEREIRLPTETEWEKAATPAHRKYPWGGPWGEAEPDAGRANFGRNVGSPTPVGIYPAGNGRYGHCDLAGNVSEWCGDVPNASTERLILGRNFRDLMPPDLRMALRLRDSACRRDDCYGFRCAAAAPASTVGP